MKVSSDPGITLLRQPHANFETDCHLSTSLSILQADDNDPYALENAVEESKSTFEYRNGFMTKKFQPFSSVSRTMAFLDLCTLDRKLMSSLLS